MADKHSLKTCLNVYQVDRTLSRKKNKKNTLSDILNVFEDHSCLYKTNAKIGKLDWVLISRWTQIPQIRLQIWFARFSLRLDTRNTEYLITDKNKRRKIQMDRKDFPRTKGFKYLGSTISSSILSKITAQINAAWLKWHIATGIRYNPRISNQTKSKISWDELLLCTAPNFGRQWKKQKENYQSQRWKYCIELPVTTRHDHVQNIHIHHYKVIPTSN